MGSAGMLAGSEVSKRRSRRGGWRGPAYGVAVAEAPDAAAGLTVGAAAAAAVAVGAGATVAMAG
jgi:hypothetical protein